MSHRLTGCWGSGGVVCCMRGVSEIDAPWPRAEMKTDGIDEQRSEIRRRVRVNRWGRVDNMFGVSACGQAPALYGAAMLLRC